jgi:hypothetical protein
MKKIAEEDRKRKEEEYNKWKVLIHITQGPLCGLKRRQVR